LAIIAGQGLAKHYQVNRVLLQRLHHPFAADRGLDRVSGFLQVGGLRGQYFLV